MVKSQVSNMGTVYFDTTYLIFLFRCLKVKVKPGEPERRT